jgi:NitT/TauT family transport system substrate-binding protein
MNRRTVLAAGATLLALPSLARAQALTSITVGGVPEESATPALWAAGSSGIFKRNGLDVTIEAQNSGSAIAAAVAGGSYAIGKSSLVSLIIAHAKSVPFVLVGAGGLYDTKAPNFGLVVKADSPIKTAADLNGKSCAVSAINDLYTIGVKAWMDKNGGDSTTLKLLELPISAVADAIAAGRIDSGGLIDPELQSGIDAGKVRWLARDFDAIAPRFMYTGWFTTTDYVAKNRTTVLGFVKALREANAFVSDHPAATVDVMAAYTKIDPARIAKMNRIKYATVLDPKLIQPMIDACAKYKVIPAAFDAKEMIAAGLG